MVLDNEGYLIEDNSLSGQGEVEIIISFDNRGTVLKGLTDLSELPLDGKSAVRERGNLFEYQKVLDCAMDYPVQILTKRSIPNNQIDSYLNQRLPIIYN